VSGGVGGRREGGEGVGKTVRGVGWGGGEDTRRGGFEERCGGWGRVGIIKMVSV